MTENNDSSTSKEAFRDSNVSSLSRAQWRSAMTVLVFVYILNFLDRQIINILAEPIKQELDLADWQLGLLTGFAFAFFYALAGIPIARLAERSNRSHIIGVAVGIWSVFTMVCGLANSYIQMLLFRMGVGIGEAGLVPPANSLITDITPREKLASALSIFYLGLPLGSLLGLAFGGVVADLAGWRMAFILAGAPGLLAMLLIFWLVPEPRKALTSIQAKQELKSNFSESLVYLKGKRSYVMCVIAAAAISITTYAHQAFGPAFYFRVHAQELASMASLFGMKSSSFLGLSFGFMLGVFGVAGLFISGRIADELGKKDPGNYCLVPAIALTLFVPFQIAALMVPSLMLSLVLFGISLFFTSFWFAPVQATIQSVAPKHMRATASSIVLLGINLIGLGLGPLLLGIFSDVFSSMINIDSSLSIQYAMIVMIVFTLISIAALFHARHHVKNDCEY